MRQDYILEIVEELGRILRTIITMKKSNPSKALEEIRTAFKGTKFKDKDFFDGMGLEELAAFVEENNMDYRALDVITDLLLEEIDIRLDTANTVNLPTLIEKVDWLIASTDSKEKALKVFSFNRDVQRQRLKKLKERLAT
jgi:predicted house-cleaning noncanonical NTP pyrophosphatase (MazG superfamily)